MGGLREQASFVGLFSSLLKLWILNLQSARQFYGFEDKSEPRKNGYQKQAHRRSVNSDVWPKYVSSRNDESRAGNREMRTVAFHLTSHLGRVRLDALSPPMRDYRAYFGGRVGAGSSSIACLIKLA